MSILELGKGVEKILTFSSDKMGNNDFIGGVGGRCSTAGRRYRRPLLPAFFLWAELKSLEQAAISSHLLQESSSTSHSYHQVSTNEHVNISFVAAIFRHSCRQNKVKPVRALLLLGNDRVLYYDYVD